MGKSGRKWKESVSMNTVLNAINTLPIKDLMYVAKLTCGSDYAVMYYNNKKHPQFYHNDEAFRKTLRRCVAIGAFEHRAQIIYYLALDNSENNILNDLT